MGRIKHTRDYMENLLKQAKQSNSEYEYTEVIIASYNKEMLSTEKVLLAALVLSKTTNHEILKVNNSFLIKFIVNKNNASFREIIEVLNDLKDDITPFIYVDKLMTIHCLL